MADRDHDKPASSDPPLTPESPPTKDELEAAERLRLALDEGAPGDDVADLARVLAAAWSPGDIDAAEHDAIVERALERTMASRQEQQSAAELRRALEDESVPSEEADLARSLKSAWAPKAIDARDHERIVERAVSPAAERIAPARRGVVVRVMFGASAALALAAGVLLWIGKSQMASAPMATAPQSVMHAAELAQSRSTQELFDKPFERGSTSARIDRIAVARAGDLRENRFAMWGVR